MSDTPAVPVGWSDDVKVLAVAEAAERLTVPTSRVHQMIRDGSLLGVRREGALVVPEDFLDGSGVVKGLPGTITVLRDGGYDDGEILRWLFAEDDSLPGTPIEALRGNRGPRSSGAPRRWRFDA
ncbi:MAG: hypothetical protein JWR88_1708, partial [Pseudonocardia sp.]|nr:hypothetical protein [Pseudonocardia sp.]